jgi:acyl-CoA hydrolase
MLNICLINRVMKAKKVSESCTVMCEMVMPNDANTLGNLRGGKLIDWMDIAGEITAQRHSERAAVTASMDQVFFQEAIKVGDIVTIEAQITRVFNTSIEIMIEVWSETKTRSKKIKTNEARFTYVAVDHEGKPSPVSKIKPIGKKELQLYEEAGKRKQRFEMQKV